jgi:hypothetical protein
MPVKYCLASGKRPVLESQKRRKSKRRKISGSAPLARSFTQTVKLPSKPTVLRVKNCNPIDVNTNYIIYWQIGPMTIKDYAR